MTRIAGSRLAFLLLAAGSCAFAADPVLLNLAMPDARVLAGLNATSAKISPLGQFILSQVPGADAHFQAVVTLTGFDPSQDVAEVLAASAGDPANPAGLLLVRGTFEPNSIIAALTGKPNVTIETRDGNPLITVSSPKQKLPRGIAFIGTSLAITGDLASVTAALDRSKSSNSIDPALAVQVNTLSTSNDAWFVSAAPASAFVPAKAAAATGPAAAVLGLLKSIQSSSGGIKLGSNVQFSAEAVASDAPSAGSLVAVVQLLKALAGSSAQLQNALPLIQAIQATTSGNAMDLALTVPESQLESLLTSLKPQAKTAQTTPQSRPRRRRTPTPGQQN